MSLKKYKTKIAIIFLILSIAILLFYENRVGAYSSYFIGKIQYGSDLQLNGFSIELPDDWWVVERNNDQVTLGKLPSANSAKTLFVFIDKRNLSEDIINYFSEVKNFGKEVTARKVLSKQSNINNINVFLFLYEVEIPVTQRDNLYIFWAAPKINITISAANISSHYKDDFFELIDKIKFN